VNNLAYSTEENDLRNLMTEYGDINSIRIIRDESSKCKGFAYVEFYNQESVQKALGDGVRELLGRRVMLIASDSTKEKTHILHVGNLEYSVTEEQVACLFAGVKKVHIPTDKTGKSRGFALVEFVDEESARNALNSEKLVINDRPVVIKKSTRNIKPARAEVMRNEDFKKLLG
jgi:RNA recognition motif-containing protein